jgi:phage terminase large subunit-like protein
MVYAPLKENFAQEVIEECAAFPNGQYDDYVDSMTQAVIRFRQGGFVSTYNDELDAPNFKIEKEYKYY